MAKRAWRAYISTYGEMADQWLYLRGRHLDIAPRTSMALNENRAHADVDVGAYSSMSEDNGVWEGVHGALRLKIWRGRVIYGAAGSAPHRLAVVR